MARISLANTTKVTLGQNVGSATIRPPDATAAASYATAAAASAAAAAAVGSTNDTIIASRLNDTTSAAYAAGKGKQAVNVKDYGAVGNGVTNDRAAFVAAAATGRKVYVPAGNYFYSGAGLAGLSNPSFFGDGPDKSIITIDTGNYFLEPATANLTLHLSGLKFSGGAGALSNTWVGVNVNGHRVIERCTFKDYTVCAVSSNATDEPYWTFRDCQFDAANESTTIGVALNGSADNNLFQGCSFLKNRIDVYLRRPSRPSFQGCNFLPYGPSDGSTPRMGVWLGTTSFQDPVFTDCKFGNENITSRDWQVVIADPVTPTDPVGAHVPQLAADSTAICNGLTFDGCDLQGASGAAPPLVYSTTPNLRGARLSVNLGGTQPTYIVQFRTVPFAADRLNQGNVIGPITGSDNMGTENVPPIPSNADGWARVIDPQGVFTHVGAVRQNGVGDPTSYVNLLTTALNSFVLTNTTKTQVTDSMGGTDAVEFTFSASAFARSATLTLANITPGRPAWVEFDVKPGSSSPITALKAWLQYTSSGAIHFQRHLTVPGTGGWVRHRFQWTPREATTSIFLEFSPSGTQTGTVQVGRARVYHSHEPLNVDGNYPKVAVPQGQLTVGGVAVGGNPNGLARAAGEETLDRRLTTTGGLTMTSGVLRLVYLYAYKTETINNVLVHSGTTAAGTPTHCQIGVYSVDGSGNLTLLANTTDDTTIFAAANTPYTRALSGAVSKVAGQMYAIGYLVTATTMPTLPGSNTFGGSAVGEPGQAPRICGSYSSGLTAVPASIANGSVGNVAGVTYAVLLP